MKHLQSPVFATIMSQKNQQGYEARRDIADQKSQENQVMDAREDKRTSAPSAEFRRAQLCAPTGKITRTTFTRHPKKNYKQHKSKVGPH